MLWLRKAKLLGPGFVSYIALCHQISALTQAQLSAAVTVQLGFEWQPPPKRPFLTMFSKINGPTKIEKLGTREACGFFLFLLEVPE